MDSVKQNNTYHGERPPKTAKKARKIWDAFVEAGVRIIELWFNPNCWCKRPPIVGNAWGWWGVRYRHSGGIQVTMFLPQNPLEIIVKQAIEGGGRYE